VTKGMSENAISNVKKTVDKVVHPISVIAKGDTIAHHKADDGDPAEREDYGPNGTSERGFAGSLVPTLEEKMIYERKPDAKHANGKPLFDLIEEGEVSPPTSPSASPNVTDGPSDRNGMKEATVPTKFQDKDGKETVDPNQKKNASGVPRIQSDPEKDEYFGAPANAYDRDDKAPHKGRGQGKDGDGNGDGDADADSNKNGRDGDRGTSKEEDLAVKARQTLRKHLNAKVGVSAYTMPTPTPIIDPNLLHDPLDPRSLEMWTGTAVHNVRGAAVVIVLVESADN
jgi:phospholipase D1/2